MYWTKVLDSSASIFKKLIKQAFQGRIAINFVHIRQSLSNASSVQTSPTTWTSIISHHSGRITTPWTEQRWPCAVLLPSRFPGRSALHTISCHTTTMSQTYSSRRDANSIRDPRCERFSRLEKENEPNKRSIFEWWNSYQWKSIFTFCLHFSARTLSLSFSLVLFFPQIGCVSSHIHPPPVVPIILRHRPPRSCLSYHVVILLQSLSSLSHAPLELFTSHICRGMKSKPSGTVPLLSGDLQKIWLYLRYSCGVDDIGSDGGKTHSPARMDCNFGSNEWACARSRWARAIDRNGDGRVWRVDFPRTVLLPRKLFNFNQFNPVSCPTHHPATTKPTLITASPRWWRKDKRTETSSSN